MRGVTVSPSHTPMICPYTQGKEKLLMIPRRLSALLLSFQLAVSSLNRRAATKKTKFNISDGRGRSRAAAGEKRTRTAQAS